MTFPSSSGDELNYREFKIKTKDLQVRKRTSSIIGESWLGSQGEDMDKAEWKRTVKSHHTATVSEFSTLNRQL